jgi:hypothetical protein
MESIPHPPQLPNWVHMETAQSFGQWMPHDPKKCWGLMGCTSGEIVKDWCGFY